MDSFFIDYKDPIFSIIILISSALIIAISSYLWGVFSKRDEESKIENFIKKFSSSKGLSPHYQTLLRSGDIGSETLGVLAKVFSKSGDFDRAINIYLIALESVKDRKEKEFILTNLGKIYFQAGFLKKSEEILLKALEIGPRNEKALKILSVIYERLKEYKKELEVLDALKEQGVETSKSSQFVKAQIIANNANLSFDEKVEKLLEFDLNFMPRFILELHIKNSEPLSKMAVFPELEDSIDIIWHLKESVNLESSEYKALFFAKNLSNEYEKSEFFEVEAISAMRKGGYFSADLSFKYICQSCKSTLPSFFYRCPICYELESVKIMPRLTRRDDEISMPF